MKSLGRKGWIAALGLTTLGGLSLWGYFRAQDKTHYQTVRLETGPITASVSATGTCNAVTTVQVGSQVSGNIKQLFADFNTRVEKDQVVARIDPEIFQARVSQAQAGVEAARAAVQNAQVSLRKSQTGIDSAQASLNDATANLKKTEVAVADAKMKLDRAAGLFQQGIIATQDRDTAQINYDSSIAGRDVAKAQVQSAEQNLLSSQEQRELSQAELLSAQAQLKQAGETLRQAEIDLDHTYIRAPVDGTVISRNVDVGQTVAASLQAPTLFLIAQDLTKMKVDTSVDEADIGKVRTGQTASFTVDAYPAEEFTGTVLEIRKAPIEVQNVVTYDVVIGVSNPRLKLFPGMTANVSIAAAHRDSVLRIPEAALRFQPSEPAAVVQLPQHASPRETVWVLGQDGRPQPVSVKLGISDGKYAELVRGRLEAGENAIVGVSGGKASTSTARRGGLRF